jgi:hypothetical protein
LNPDFFANFSTNNQTSPETIFAVPLDATKQGGMDLWVRTLHFKQQTTYNTAVSPWNGYCTLAEFYNTFAEEDVRKKMWLVGQQYDAAGKPLEDEGVPLAYVPDVPSLDLPPGPAGRVIGARGVKYQIQQNLNSVYADNDFVIFRLGDAYLMRGEANFRQGKVAEALADLNLIREQRGVEPFTDLTEQAILEERGRELAWEYHRRQDLIRFGQFTAPRRLKPASEKYRELFPIPSTQLSLNPYLKQNPGY